jgi:hypothetical protein
MSQADEISRPAFAQNCENVTGCLEYWSPEIQEFVDGKIVGNRF